MRLLLRDYETGEFYKSPDVWVQSPAAATTFASIEKVVEERKKISRLGLDMVAMDQDDRVRFGVRLWRSGVSKE